MMKELADMRRSYLLDNLDISSLDKDPMESFKKWFDEAKGAKVAEPNAMTLATADKNGFPSARIVLLKGIDERGFIFYTNYTSQKSQDISENPNACLLFFWQEMERQVKITGKVEKVSSSESEAYFHSRPRESQIGAWTSPQSSTIEDRAFLERRYRDLEKKFSDTETIPLPHFWGGYVVIPTEIEFWQGRASRLHDRIVYKKTGNKWKMERLAP